MVKQVREAGGWTITWQWFTWSILYKTKSESWNENGQV